MNVLRVLDLFSGTGGFSSAFLGRGHHVMRIDNDPKFADVSDTMIADVLTQSFESAIHAWDVVLASPPCQAFSLGAGGTHIGAFGKCAGCGATARKVHEVWKCGVCDHHVITGAATLRPVSEFGKLSVALVERTLSLIDIIQPRFWWMENPNGGMIHFVPIDIPRVQITQCAYGTRNMKLTNLWGNWPASWAPRPRCKNGDRCHDAARRGAKTGTQGIKGATARAIIPYELSLEICQAVEGAQ